MNSFYLGNKLKREGINFLKSFFSDIEDQKSINQKFNNISGKTGSYFVEDFLFLQRTSRKNRSLVPFEHIKNNKLTYSKLNSFECGVVVEFVNNDFFDQLELPENQQHEIFKKLKNKLGSDENVSAIITIRSTGLSSSQTQRFAYERLKKYLNENNIIEKENLVQRKDEYKSKNQNSIGIGIGNDKWKGFIYYNISGGNHETLFSHSNFEKKEVSLFNPFVEAANEFISLDITLVLIYFAFFSIPVHKRFSEWNEIVSKYNNFLKARIYDSGSLYDYVSSHICLTYEKEILIDPIQFEPILIEDFAIKKRTANSLDIAHQIAVEKQSYIYDQSQKMLLTPARPQNFFWLKHLSNMMQQNFSLEDYHRHLLQISEKLKKYYK